ncbi:MAG: flotillin [Thermoproteota archaeon]|nr:flotillin [Thermoproteota archaeon]
MFEGLSIPLLWGMLIIIAAIVVVVSFIKWGYVVVPPHEAHVVVSRGKGKKVFWSKVSDGQKLQSAYWYIPFSQRRIVIPLENIRIKIDSIPLRDQLMAKFSGDVICYLSVVDPLLAAEKLGRIEMQEARTGFPRMEAEVGNLIEAITRNASMSMEVYEIMRHRDAFSQEVKKRVNEPLLDWGIQLVDLEVIHFRDVENYTVIKDLEQRQASLISSETRKQVADNQKGASIVESLANKETEMAKAENEELFRIRQIQKDQRVGQSQQESAQKIAEIEMEANKQKVEAQRVLSVGTAQVGAQARIEQAKGDSEAIKTKADGDSEATRKTGFAEAEVSKAKLIAEADGTKEKAFALKEYTDAGLSLETIRADVDIKKAQFAALAEGLKVAKISIVTSGESNILGIPVSAKAGADIGQMLYEMAEHGIDVKSVLDKLPLETAVKLATAEKLGLTAVKEAEKQIEKEKTKTQDRTGK